MARGISCKSGRTQIPPPFCKKTKVIIEPAPPACPVTLPPNVQIALTWNLNFGDGPIHYNATVTVPWQRDWFYLLTFQTTTSLNGNPLPIELGCWFDYYPGVCVGQPYGSFTRLDDGRSTHIIDNESIHNTLPFLADTGILPAGPGGIFGTGRVVVST